MRLLTRILTRNPLGKLAVLAFALCAAVHPAVAAAVAHETPAVDPLHLRIAVSEFQPFAIKGADGSWHGRAVDLFVATARDAGAEVELVEVPMQAVMRMVDKESLDGTAVPIADVDGTLGIVSLTPDWGFAELHIATNSEERLLSELRLFTASLVGARQWRVYATLAAMMVLFGLLIWRIERGRNANFQGKHGLGLGLWWSIATLSTVGYGDAVPRTALGRVAAGSWMLISMVLVALFTATVTSALTAAQSEVHVQGASDLARARVGIVENAPAEVYFADHFLPHVSYPTIGEAIHDLGKGTLDAVVSDRDVLLTAIAAESRDHALEHPVRVIPQAIGRRPLAFGLRRSLPADFIHRFDEALVARVRAQSQPSTPASTPASTPVSAPGQTP